MYHAIRRRRFIAITLLAAVPTLTACSKDDDHDDEPEVAFIELTIGATTIRVDEGGNVTGGPVSIARDTDVAVTARFLRANGQPDPLVTADEFRLTGEPVNPGGITFTSTAAFTGTLRGLQAGIHGVRFGLLHVAENHTDFGPLTVSITVQ
jgi:hypothetical protein